MTTVNQAHPSTPLDLIVCRQGNAEPVAGLAHAIQHAVRGSTTTEDAYLATISDLPVPLRNFSSCPETLPPDTLVDQTLHTLVVLLVDEAMMANPAWSKWIKACEKLVRKAQGRHRLIALCTSDDIKQSFKLIKDAPETRHTQVIGYHDKQDNGDDAFGEYAEKSAWICLYVLQSCRHLLARKAFESSEDAEKLKLRLFISHAKKDSLPLANSIRLALRQKDYFNTWYDAEDLDGVEDWRDEIRKGVNSAAVIVLRTEAYDSRPWCRQEFVWADQCAVPLICVDARNGLEYTADALSTSRAPTVRIPDGNLFRVLFLALKESLRILQLQRILQDLKECHAGVSWAQATFLIPYTPNLQNLAFAAKVIADKREHSTSGYNIILYADPPLTPELYQASKGYLEAHCGKTYLLTPLLLPFWQVNTTSAQRSPHKLTTASLLKTSVNISISEHHGDMERLGFSGEEIKSFTVQIAQALIANEAIAVFGHDWRSDGVMQEIYRFGEEHQSVVLHEHQRSGLLKNYCHWGMRSILSERERSHMRGILDVIQCDRPDDPRLEAYATASELPKALRIYALARSLTTMRRTMTEGVYARICLGGRDMDPARPEEGPFGRCPGVIEEALMSCLADQPLYLSGLLGGVTQHVIDALQGRETGLNFSLPAEVATCYAGVELDTPPMLKKSMTKTTQKQWLDYEGLLTNQEIFALFRHYGLKRLAKNNGLTISENISLFRAATIDDVTYWVLTGLARLKAREKKNS